jgi:hypothetical protein
MNRQLYYVVQFRMDRKTRGELGAELSKYTGGDTEIRLECLQKDGTFKCYP